MPIPEGLIEPVHTEHKLTLRNLREGDYPDIKRSMEQVYQSLGGALPEPKLRSIIKTFPKGEICEGAVRNYLDRQPDLDKAVWLGDK